MSDPRLRVAETLERHLIENGLLDEGQPTMAAHLRYVDKMTAEFTPEERWLIRHEIFGEPSND